MSGVHRFFLLWVFCTLGIAAHAQEFDEQLFWQRDSAIERYAASGAYQDVQKHADAQIAFLQKVGRPDSVYRYAYNAARSMWKNKGTEAGVKRSEELVNWIMANDANVDHHLEALNDLTWIYDETGNGDKCIEADQRYLDICLSFDNVKPMQLSTAYYSLGYDYQISGDGKKAAYYLSKSIEPLLVDTFRYRERLIDCYNGQGTALFRIGDFVRAKKSLNTSLKYIAMLTDSLKVSMAKANAFGNLSLISNDEGNLIESKNYLYQSLRARQSAITFAEEGFQKDQQHRFLISNYHNLAALYLELGDLARAEKLSLHVRDLRRKFLVPDHPDHNKSLEAFGSIRFAMSDYDEALKNFEEYLTFCESHFGVRSYYSAVANQRLGKLMYQMEEFDKAIGYFTKAIEIGQLISDDYSGDEMFTSYLIRSDAHGALGNYPQAEKDVRAALTIYNLTRKQNDPLFGKAYITMCGLKMKQGQNDSAEYYADLSLALLLDKQREQITQFGRNLGALVEFLPYTFYTKAMVVKLKDSGVKGLEESMKYLQQSVDYLRETKNFLDDDASRMNYYDEHVKTFNAAQDVCFELYDATDDPAMIARMLGFAEENKSILLRRQLQHFTSLRVSNVPDSIISQERVLVSQLSESRSAIEEGKNFEDYQKEYEDLLANIKTNYPAYFNLRYQEKTATLDDIRRLLVRDNANFIQYIITDDKAYGLLLNKNHTKLIRLEFQDLKDFLFEYNTLIVNQQTESFKEVSIALYQAIFKPFEPFVKGNELLIVADDELINVNFETLIRPGKEAKPDYLIYDYTISYLISSTSAVQYSELKRGESDGILAFAPGFFDDLKLMYTKEMKDSSSFDEKYLQRIQQPFAVRTAEQVAGIFSGKAFTKEQATERNFKDEAGKYRIIHLGTHTEVNNISPLLSRLVLTKSASDGQDANDGYLHAYEIYNLSLRAELAVLTACETGAGKRSVSEGVLSLAHSFAFAGCPSVVMSLWQIDEKTSAQIIESFYENLADGMSKNEALRAAKLSYLEANPGELSDPYYWSGLILLGDTAPLTNASEVHPLLIVLLILAGFSLIFLFFRWRKKIARNYQ